MMVATLPLEPTPEMIDAGAQRLVRWWGDCTWPDSFDPLDVAAARNQEKLAGAAILKWEQRAG